MIKIQIVNCISRPSNKCVLVAPAMIDPTMVGVYSGHVYIFMCKQYIVPSIIHPNETIFLLTSTQGYKCPQFI